MRNSLMTASLVHAGLRLYREAFDNPLDQHRSPALIFP
ncbi:hypothetical protein PS880_05895 [Pseudomonas fluorescens]|uniref:Uncharacterized protein n=1 Tax=Pseudomonas fluorescens TaxID=294 RepID=A0A5E7Q8Q9_PSEFL|nr:hypothetical protein PS880_05895 [Pseudomonas fluorescens]